jgi:hypothetical protein
VLLSPPDSDKAPSELSYPASGRALLPTVLVPYFGEDAVPEWLASAHGLPEGLKLGDLDEGIWDRFSPESIDALVKHIVTLLVYSRRRLIDATELVFTKPAPLSQLRVPPRARNALIRNHITTSDGVVEPVSVRVLANLRQVGGLSLLQLLAASEEWEGAPRTAADLEANAGAPSDVEQPVLPERRVERRVRAVPTREYRRGRAEPLSRDVRREAIKLARRPWGRHVSYRDSRLGVDLRRLDPLAPNAHVAAKMLQTYPYSTAAGRAKAASIRRFVSRGDALAHLSLEAELNEILRMVANERQQKVLRRRFGWDGKPPGTLEDAANQINVTRERARQIELKFKRRRGVTWTPALDRALDLVGRIRFGTAQDVDETLRAHGLVVGSFSLASLLQAAELFGKEVPKVVSRGGLLTPTGFAKTLIEVETRASRLTSHWGATTVAELTSVLVEKGVELDEDVVRKALETSTDICFLDEEHNWFWSRSAKRNRLLNTIRKIVAVAGSIDLGELRDGVGRSHRAGGFRPPRAVLARLCEESGDYKVIEGRVFGTKALPDWHEVLSGNEQLLAEVLFEHGPVMRRIDLEQIAVEQLGMNRSSFYVYLTYLPILQRYAPGVFGLRGANVSAGGISVLIPRVVHHQVLQDHGWTEDGRVWIVYKLSSAAAQTGVLGVPAAVAEVLRGQYTLLTDDGGAIGTAVVEDTRLWGVSPFYRRRGVETGDYVLLVFDRSKKSARIEVGDESVGHRYQGD